MKISKYTKLGILMVITISILIWGLSYLKGHDFFKNTDYYHVKYERVDGLVESSPVTMNGYKIGQVKNIIFDPAYSGNLVVTFTIDGNFRIPVNSVARIVSEDIMGNKSIRLILSKQDEFYNSHDTIPGAIEGDLKEQVSMQVLPLKVKAEELLGTLDSALAILTMIFNEDAQKNLAESMANINRTIHNLEKTSADLQDLVSNEKENIRDIIQSVSTVSKSLESKSPEIERSLRNLAALSDSLSAISIAPLFSDISIAGRQIREILDKFNSNETTAGLLLNSDELHRHINQLASSLDLLTRDIRSNPGRYLHFSAINLGKDVYITANGKTGKTDDIVYKVHLVSTQVRIPPGSKLFAGLGNIEEYEASGAYTYLTGNSNDYSLISELHQKALTVFPDATIVAFKNGKLIKLEKAFKSLK